MNDVTCVLKAVESGDAQAAQELLPLVYDELRRLASARLAAEPAGQTLQATALVHEAYLRLVPGDAADSSWKGRGHFFGAAAEAMRRILIDKARAKAALKRGARPQRKSLDSLNLAIDAFPDDLLDLDDAITRLAAEEPKTAELVKLRFYAGLTLREAGELIGVSPTTADRYWAFARAWLYDALTDGADSSIGG